MGLATSFFSSLFFFFHIDPIATDPSTIGNLKNIGARDGGGPLEGRGLERELVT